MVNTDSRMTTQIVTGQLTHSALAPLIENSGPALAYADAASHAIQHPTSMPAPSALAQDRKTRTVKTVAAMQQTKAQTSNVPPIRS